MDILIHPTYLPNISNMAAMIQSESIVFEYYDNFQKQTLRNRAYIYGANGTLQLNVPLRQNTKNKGYYRDVEIAYDMDWQIVHKRSVKSAYGTSPFFEYYEDELLPIFDLKEKFLYDLNLKTTEIFFNCLQVPFKHQFSSRFVKKSEYMEDYRMLVKAKVQPNIPFQNYFQVFSSKFGFLPNLSGLDLICNLGPDSGIFLDNEDLSLF